MKNLRKTKKASQAMTVAAVLTVTNSLIFSLILRVDMSNTVIEIMVGLFVYAKFSMAIMFTQGWNVFNQKTICGMPRLLFIFYVIIVFLLVPILTCGLQMQSIPDLASSSKNILGFVASASGAIITTFCMWYAGVGKWMAKGSEYDARLEFKDNGDSDEVIEQKIIELKDSSVI